MIKYNHKNIGQNLKKILETLEISQVDFANRCGLTQASISQIIHDKRGPSIETLCRILEVLPVTFEKLTREDL